MDYKKLELIKSLNISKFINFIVFGKNQSNIYIYIYRNTIQKGYVKPCKKFSLICKVFSQILERKYEK